MKSTKRPKITLVFGIREKLARHQESRFGRGSLSRSRLECKQGGTFSFPFSMELDNVEAVQTRYRSKSKFSKESVNNRNRPTVFQSQENGNLEDDEMQMHMEMKDRP